jgi:hypothetical protein
MGGIGAWSVWGFLHTIIMVIMVGTRSKAPLRIAPTDLPLLFVNLFNFTIFADVACQRVLF